MLPVQRHGVVHRGPHAVGVQGGQDLVPAVVHPHDQVVVHVPHVLAHREPSYTRHRRELPRVPLSCPVALGLRRRELCELDPQERCLQRVHAVGVTEGLVPVQHRLPVTAELTHPLGDAGVGGGDRACVAEGAEVLARVEAEGSPARERPPGLPSYLCADGLRRVLHQQQPVPLRDRLQPGDVGGLTVQVHGDHGSRPRAHHGVDRSRVEQPCALVDVGQDGHGAAGHDRLRCSEERVGRQDDLVAGTDAGGLEQQVQRGRPRPDGDGMPRPHPRRQLLLEGLDLRTAEEDPGGEHALEGQAQPGLDRRVHGGQVDEGYGRGLPSFRLRQRHGHVGSVWFGTNGRGRFRGRDTCTCSIGQRAYQDRADRLHPEEDPCTNEPSGSSAVRQDHPWDQRRAGGLSPSLAGVVHRVVRPALRWSWLVVLCVAVAGAAAAWSSSTQVPTYRATAVLSIASEGEPVPPGRAFDAHKQAATYAAVLPEDQELLAAAALDAGVAPSTLRAGISAANLRDTPLLRLAVTARTPAAASRRLDALIRQLVGTPPARSAIVPGTLMVLRPPQGAVPLPAPPVVPIGLFLGLGLGVVCAVAAARADRRADSAASLQVLLGCPVSDLSALSPLGAAALVQHWTEQLQPTLTVALLPALDGGAAAAGEVARYLERSLPDGQLGTVTPVEAVRSARGEHHAGTQRLAFIAAGRPGGPTGGELAALGAGATFLLVRRGDPLRSVRRSAALLSDFGVQPTWCLLAPAGRRGKRRAPALEPVALHTGGWGSTPRAAEAQGLSS